MNTASTGELQKQEFLAQEGDSWYQRNRESLADRSALRDFAVGELASRLPGDSPSDVLEIGCAAGDNLAALAARRPVRGHGLDPSRTAIDIARQRHASLRFDVGTADALPYADGSFDLVWFGFCLYLVDRALLFRTVAEADRVLRDGGILAILDFDPGTPCRRAYHHRPGLHSFKMDHAVLFLANPSYRLLDKLPASHAGPGWVADPQERLALTLCRKDIGGGYRAD